MIAKRILKIFQLFKYPHSYTPFTKKNDKKEFKNISTLSNIPTHLALLQKDDEKKF
jgi:hypothetical protein